MGSVIKGIEYVYPERKVTNKELAIEFPDYDFSKFEDKVGVKNRYWVKENETALDLAKNNPIITKINNGNIKTNPINAIIKSKNLFI